MIIDIVRLDDWVAIYVDQSLHYQGHSVPNHVWIDLLLKCPSIGFVWEHDIEFTDQNNPGQCPEYLADLMRIPRNSLIRYRNTAAGCERIE